MIKPRFQNNHFSNLYHMIVVAGITLLLSGCGSRVGSGEMAVANNASHLVVDLPALYVDYDREGIAHIGSLPAVAVGEALGIDFSPLNLAADQLHVLTNANIQHIQITTLPEHLLILVNGRVVPSLVWSEHHWATTGTTMGQLIPALAPLTPLLPVAAEIGGGITLRFPLQDNASPIPLTIVEQNQSALQAGQDAYLAAIGGVPPRFAIDVFYENDGTWTVDGLDASSWGESIPLPWERLNLTPQQIETLQASGIDEFTLISRRSGLYIAVNGEQLPHLSWADGELQNVITLADEGGIFRQLLGDRPTAYSLATTLERLLPMLQLTEVELHVYFVGI